MPSWAKNSESKRAKWERCGISTPKLRPLAWTGLPGLDPRGSPLSPLICHAQGFQVSVPDKLQSIITFPINSYGVSSLGQPSAEDIERKLQTQLASESLRVIVRLSAISWLRLFWPSLWLSFLQLIYLLQWARERWVSFHQQGPDPMIHPSLGQPQIMGIPRKVQFQNFSIWISLSECHASL